MSITTRLLIARHGNTFSPHDTVKRIGITDLPLVESGLAQGRKLGCYLEKHHLIPDIIFTSQLKRAIQTAQQAQNAMQPQQASIIHSLPIFNEIDYGPDENQPEDKVLARIGAQALTEWETQARVPRGWNVDPLNIIKNWQDFAKEILQNYAGKTILVITSNGIARFAPYLTGNFAAFTTQHAIKIATGALCIFENNSPSSQWQCLEWNIKPT